MKLPSDVRALLARRFDGNHRDWLAAHPEVHWPMTIALGVPTEQAAMRQVDAVREWSAAWGAWQGAGELAWVLRQWKVLGTQRLPASLTLRGPADAALWSGQRDRWERARQRFDTLTLRWPVLSTHQGRLFGVLADYDDADFARLLDMLAWLDANPASGLYPRQLPLAGVDSKWIEPRKAVLTELVTLLRQTAPAASDFYAVCGLKRPPAQIRMRVLDPALRARLGGLGDITAPVGELARLALPASLVLIVENIQTGLVFDDIPGAVLFMGLGYGVDLLGQLPWLSSARCLYWGDIDTHGFAILNRARSHIPALESFLMGEQTLLRFQPLWSREATPHPSAELAQLTAREAGVHRGLKDNTWAQNARLEQERIGWDYAQDALRALLAQPT